MIYHWHGYGVDAMVVARPNENNYLFKDKVDTEPKVVTEILCLGLGLGLELIILGTLSLFYYAHSITPC